MINLMTVRRGVLARSLDKIFTAQFGMFSVVTSVSRKGKISLKSIMDWIVSPQYSSVEAQTTSVTYLTSVTSLKALSPKRLFKEVTKFKYGHKGGLWSKRTGVLIIRGRDIMYMHTEERPREDTAKMWPLTSQAKKPQEKLVLLAPWPQNSSL